MKILIITIDYPDKIRSVFTFVKQFADGMASLGHEIHVVAPYSLSHNKRLCRQIETNHVDSGSVTVYRPYFISFSNIVVGKWRPSSWAFRNAVKRGIKMVRQLPDVVYGHFWGPAFLGYEYARSNRLPLFVASGESVIYLHNDSEPVKSFCDYVSGVICVSTKNRDESISHGLATCEKCIVIPNGVNTRMFHVMDKTRCRSILNLPSHVFIVIFVGWFNERKGVRRVAQAINLIEGEPIYSIFLGGKENVGCKKVLFCDRVDHASLPLFLNAADVFVLPTLHEGCSNAIIEAMACGLPVISSDLPFNRDVLNESNSILVDPLNINQIADAIKELRDDSAKRSALSKCAVETARDFDLNRRIEKVQGFVYKRVEKFSPK